MFKPLTDAEARAASGHNDFAPLIQPRNDRVLIRRLEEPSNITLTDAPKAIKGRVLAVGPGKWHPGEWRKGLYATEKTVEGRPIHGIGWHWVSGWRESMEVKPGDLVLFNSKWNDLAHAENIGTGADGKGPLERPLSFKLDPMVHLVTEGDIFCILDHNVPAKYLGTAVEEQFFKNTSTAEECFQKKVGPR